MVAHHPERFGHASSSLGHAYHAQKHRAENLLLTAHRLFQRRTRLDGLPHPRERRAEGGHRKLLFEARKGFGVVDTRVEVRSELPAELRELARAHPAEED